MIDPVRQVSPFKTSNNVYEERVLFVPSTLFLNSVGSVLSSKETDSVQ